MSEEKTGDLLDPAAIHGYHAHVYYDGSSKGEAAKLRVALAERFAVDLGHWHDKPIGPHPMGSYQVSFGPDLFAEILPWLALNRRGLTIFVHPETGDTLRDHLESAIWLGEQRALDAEFLKRFAAQFG